MSTDPRFRAIEQVFGLPDVWTVRPSTFGEMDPSAEMRARLCGSEHLELPVDVVRKGLIPGD